MRLLLLSFFCVIACAQDRIGLIEFFGTTGTDLAKLRAALPVKEGEPMPDDDAQIRQAVRRFAGKDATDVAAVCCVGQSDSILFIGLPGSNARSIAHNPAPTGPERLPEAAVQLFEQTMAALLTAITSGDNGEDRKTGYALGSNAALRAKQLEIREYALANQPLLMLILKSSSDGEHRAIAAHFLGYAQQSLEQIAALIAAVRDPDENVRNNSTRALAALADSSADIAARIDPADFVAMLSSVTWSDRNKANMILGFLTRSRAPQLLAVLREQALESLLEMGRWKSHGADSLTILGRIAGIEEVSLKELVEKGETEPIFRAVRP